MKNKKIIKKIGAVALAGIMATSFAGCRSQIDKTELENSNNKIYLQNDDNMELVVLGFEKKQYGVCLAKERYGYFLDDDKKSFYDVLDNDTLDLTICNDVYNIYYTTFDNVLSSEDYVLIKSAGYIDKEYLEKKLEKNYRFYCNEDGIYGLKTYLGSNYFYVPSTGVFEDTFSKITYEDEENLKEETTLKKVK